MPCWVCGGSNYAGMSKTQAEWHRGQYKALEAIQKDVFKNRSITDTAAFHTFRAHLNIACAKLGIAQLAPVWTVANNKADQPFLDLKAELKELERRLVAIPLKMAQPKTMVAAA